MGWFDSGKAARLSDSVLLIVWSEVIKLTAGEGLSCDILILTEDANSAADGDSCAFVVTWGERIEMKCVGSLLGYRNGNVKIDYYNSDQ